MHSAVSKIGPTCEESLLVFYAPRTFDEGDALQHLNTQTELCTAPDSSGTQFSVFMRTLCSFAMEASAAVVLNPASG